MSTKWPKTHDWCFCSTLWKHCLSSLGSRYCYWNNWRGKYVESQIDMLHYSLLPFKVDGKKESFSKLDSYKGRLYFTWMLHESSEMLMSYTTLPPPTRARLFLHDLPYQTQSKNCHKFKVDKLNVFSSGYKEINYFSHWLYNLDWQIWKGKMLPVVSGGEQIWATSPSAIKDVLCILLIVCQTSKFSSCAKAYQKISLTSFGVEVRTEKTKEK